MIARDSTQRTRRIQSYGAWCVLCCVVLAPAVLAQSPAPVPAPAEASAPIPFATFPKPAADLAFLDPVWPARWGRADGQLQGVVIDMDNQVRLESRREFMSMPADRTKDAESLKLVSAAGVKAPDTFAFEGPGSFVYGIPAPKDGQKPAPRQDPPAMTFRFVSGEVQVSVQGADPVESVLLQRTWFNVFDPIPAEGDKPSKARGIALLMPGLFGTPEGTLSQLTTSLRKRGWIVLRMLSQPSRFTEKVDFELSTDGHLEAQAQRIAQLVGDRAAECAFAAQAAFAHVEQNRPELRGLPSIVIGFSGGAMSLPTVVAREPARYAAAILVGGGADYWLMNERSNYRAMVDAIHEKWDQPPTPETLARLDQLYLRSSPLDSYHTAAALKGKPVLMIQGASDLAVPSPLGDLLWERLGKPERWVEDGTGHELLFMTLPAKFGKMMEWIDKSVK
jgi:predicted esterase